MSEAPKRIWLQLGAGEYGTHTWCDQRQDWADENGDGEPEYIRADLVDSLLKQAREEVLREASEVAAEEANWVPHKSDDFRKAILALIEKTNPGS
jgi:hypothetical protein